MEFLLLLEVLGKENMPLLLRIAFDWEEDRSVFCPSVKSVPLSFLV